MATFYSMRPDPAIGRPSYARDDDPVVFTLGNGTDDEGGVSVRAVPIFSQWQVANMVYRRGGPMVVKDDARKGDYRTWTVKPAVGGRQEVALHPLHEGGEFFRGQRAQATDPLILVKAMRPLIEHIAVTEAFDRTSAASASGRGWGDTSRNMALFHNYGFIRSTGEKRHYEEDDPIVVALKSDKDKVWGHGGKTVYAKTTSFPSLLSQLESLLKSGAKGVEVEL